MNPTSVLRRSIQIRPSGSSSTECAARRPAVGAPTASAHSIPGDEARKGVSAAPKQRRARVKKVVVRRHPMGEGLEGRLLLSTFQVNSLLDTAAVNLKTGKDASGHITLRSAIMAADAKGGSNTINLPSGTITLTIAGANEDAGATGDLDIKGNLTINGKGAAKTRN